MKKVLSIFGTRPEVIKMAPVVKALENSKEFESVICTTSQHRSMQDQMMEIFELKADYDLEVMQEGQDLFHITQAVLARLKPILEEVKPDMVLVQGDTTTSFAAALAAFYKQIPVGHVEAGLRTYNLQAPYPEEANRQLTGRITQLHFTPTEVSKNNLMQEQVPSEKIHVTGNTVIDALFWIKERLTSEAIPEAILKIVDSDNPYVLITGHRRESFGDGFLNICKAIKTLAKKYPHYHFIYPVHLNPNVQTPVYELLGNKENIHLIEPIDYKPFVYLMDKCKIVLTDSGGVQEEAPSLGKPVLVMREVTERPEGVDAGTAKLVGTSAKNIINEVSTLIDDVKAYQKMANAVNPYGDGNAASRILKAINHVKSEVYS